MPEIVDGEALPRPEMPQPPKRPELWAVVYAKFQDNKPLLEPYWCWWMSSQPTRERAEECARGDDEVRFIVRIPAEDVLAAEKTAAYKCDRCDGTGNLMNTAGQDYACDSCGGSGTFVAAKPAEHGGRPMTLRECMEAEEKPDEKEKT
jgi:hypothetical protein